MIEVPLIPEPVNRARRVLISVVVAALASAAALAGYLWHRGQLIELGRAEIRAEWELAKAQAEVKSSEAVQAQTTAHADDKNEIQIRYIERQKEVVKYVPSTDSSCPADADFVRLFNGPADGADGAEAER